MAKRTSVGDHDCKRLGWSGRQLSEGPLARLKGLCEGEVASCSPELGKADSNLFGIAVVTVDGKAHAVGERECTFMIQSTSKVFIYGYVPAEDGYEAVL